MLHSSDESSEVVQTILRIERETMEAIKEKDAEALSAVLADDFIYRTPGAPDAGKTDFLNNIASLPLKVLSIWGEELKVNVYGETALLTGIQRVRTQDADGREEAGAGAFVDMFVRRQGRWLMVLAYNIDLPVASNEPPHSQGLP